MSATAKIPSAAPFYLCYLNVPLLALAVVNGGFWILGVMIFNFILIGFFDEIAGLLPDNPDPNTPDQRLFWHRLAILMWWPIQAVLSLGSVYYTIQIAGHSLMEGWLISIITGVIMGGVGIVFAHEMMHQNPRHERHLADLLMGMTLYGHFRSEHLLVHHRYVGTPRDPVTARYSEGFWKYFRRVVPQQVMSAWRAEKAMLARRGDTMWSLRNPFWKYGAISLAFLGLAIWLGGWWGLLMYVNHCLVAIILLEATNYVEHYGLTREYLGDGKYEHVKPRHSWNAAHKISNYALVNLQRHSDHHFKPDRRYPLLQTYDEEDAPNLPYGYPTMVAAAMVPRFWKSRMNPRVRAWRKQFYPHIEDWTDYNQATNPAPAR